MRISFDLDDTLICYGEVPAEPGLSRWKRWRYPEPLRKGAVALLQTLSERGWQVWIYTTSYRSQRSVRGWLRSYGIVVGGVINQADHDRVVGRQGPSKYPPDFGIDLHVDDLEGVVLEGQRHGFDVLIVTPSDPDWAARVLQYADLRLLVER